MAQEITERANFTSSSIKGGRDVDRLEDGLSAVEGVRDVNVNTDNHSVEVIFDPTVTSSTSLQAEVEALGYALDSSGGASSS